MNRDELKAIIREVLVEMFTGVPVSSANDGLTDFKQAWKPLGYPSYDALYKDMKAGLLRRGKEVFDRRKPGAKQARWVIDIEAAKKRMKEDPTRRRSV